MAYEKPKQLARLALAGCAALACSSALAVTPPNPVPNDQSKPALLVCQPGDTGNASVQKWFRVYSDGYWSVKGSGEDSYGGGEWVAAYEEQMRDLVQNPHGWNISYPNARWITPVRAQGGYDPKVSTEYPYLFARALRIGKLAKGAEISGTVNMSMFRVDECVQRVGLYTPKEGWGKEFDADAPNKYLDCSSTASQIIPDSDVSDWDWRSGDSAGKYKDNWVIFQVKTSAATHTEQNPLALAAAISIETSLDCTCPEDSENPGKEQVQDGQGNCVDKASFSPEKLVPEMLVCYPADTDVKGDANAPGVERTKRIFTGASWVFNETGAELDADKWSWAHVPPRNKYGTDWALLPTAQVGPYWLTPGEADLDPPIDTSNSYLFARAMRVGKLVEGARVEADKYGDVTGGTGTRDSNTRFFVDGTLSQFWATTQNLGDVEAFAQGDSTLEKYIKDHTAHSYVLSNPKWIREWGWTGGADNWLIFQVKNNGNAHDETTPLGFAASVSVMANLDCSECSEKGEVQNGEGECALPICKDGQAVQAVEDGKAVEVCDCPAPRELDSDGKCNPAPCDVGQSVGDLCDEGDMVDDGSGVWKPICTAGQAIESPCVCKEPMKKVGDVCVCSEGEAGNADGVCKPLCSTGDSTSSGCVPAGDLVVDGGIWVPICTDGQAVSSPCACIEDGMEVNKDGYCVEILPVARCAAPSGCSSAPATGWPALLGFGAALPLLVRRRRRK